MMRRTRTKVRGGRVRGEEDAIIGMITPGPVSLSSVIPRRVELTNINIVCSCSVAPTAAAAAGRGRTTVSPTPGTDGL